jgi:cytochrome b
MDSCAPVDARVRALQVWDPVVRVCHWTLALGFTTALLAEDGDLVHQVAGFLAASAVAVRLLWGFIGPEYARFSSFVPGPRRLFDHFSDLLHGRDRRYIGHNPAAGAMALALLGLVLVLGGTGWMLVTDRFHGTAWLEPVHESAAFLALGLVVTHVAGAVYGSIRHSENLPWAMITGRKRP